MWKFIHNGEGWWLRLESLEQLAEYSNFDTRAADALSTYIHVGLGDREHTNLSRALEFIGENREINAVEAALVLKQQLYQICLNLIQEKGFININSAGGCNNIDYKVLQVEKRDTLSFPHYTLDDIRIQTFAPQDYREGYHYHYYAYLGNLQLKDGNQVKWNTKSEALEFAAQFIQGTP